MVPVSAVVPLLVVGLWAVVLVCVASALCAGHADGRDRALRVALHILGDDDQEASQ